MADKVLELADKIRFNRFEGMERIIAAELKPLLDAVDGALLIAHHAQGECGSDDCTVQTCGFMKLAAEVRDWGKRRG